MSTTIEDMPALDPDYPHSPVVDQGFHHIPWAIEFFDAFCSPIDIIHHAYEYNIPILAMGSNSFHGQVSFIQLDASNVILSSIKEIEADLQNTPQVFYKLNLNEYGIIFRFIEYGGYTTSCHVAINSAILCKEAIEVDLLERIVDNGIQFSDVQLSENQLSFTINPYEIKFNFVNCSSRMIIFLILRTKINYHKRRSLCTKEVFCLVVLFYLFHVSSLRQPWPKSPVQ